MDIIKELFSFETKIYNSIKSMGFYSMFGTDIIKFIIFLIAANGLGDLACIKIKNKRKQGKKFNYKEVK